MDSNEQNQNLKSAQSGKALQILPAIVGLFCGIIFGLALYWFEQWEPINKFTIMGALLGGAAGLCWRVGSKMWEKFRLEDLEDWEITEIEIDTLGHKWKLANAGAQRRVAWSLFVETVTRSGTPPIADTEGDDGAALKSLYTLFQSTRENISKMEPTRLLPSRQQDIHTVETYALAMLNQDIRPFLSKWHPQWDAWYKINENVSCTRWEHHMMFRAELKALQERIKMRAQGLGEIAGVPQIERFMPMASHSENITQD